MNTVKKIIELLLLTKIVLTLWTSYKHLRCYKVHESHFGGLDLSCFSYLSLTFQSYFLFCYSLLFIGILISIQKIKRKSLSNTYLPLSFYFLSSFPCTMPYTCTQSHIPLSPWDLPLDFKIHRPWIKVIISVSLFFQ